MRYLSLVMGSIMVIWGIIVLIPDFILLIYTKGTLMKILFEVRSLLVHPIVAATIVILAGSFIIFHGLRHPRRGTLIQPPSN